MKQSRRGALASAMEEPAGVRDPSTQALRSVARWPRGRAALSLAHLVAGCAWLKVRRWKKALVL